MRWLVVAKNLDNGRLEIITPDMEFDDSSPNYDNTVHIIPFKEEPNPQHLDFGVHELVKNCVCHPKITESWVGQSIITHSAKVN